MTRCIGVAVLASLVVIAGNTAQAGPAEHQAAALEGADRLLDVQFGNGAFPWIVDDPGEFQNIQGVTALGLLDAYALNGDPAYLGDAGDGTGAAGNVDWHTDFFDADPGNFFSSGSYSFLADYEAVTGDSAALQMADDAFQRRLDDAGGATAMAENIIQIRDNQGHTLLGIWDVALFVRGAQDIGRTTEADAMADVLVDQVNNQTIVDPYDDGANWYELGLSSLLFGLHAADPAAHAGIISEAADRLKATQCGDGSFPTTSDGDASCGDVQSTAYAVIGLTDAQGLVPEAVSGCDNLVATQLDNGGWDTGGDEFAEVDAEAVSALAGRVPPPSDCIEDGLELLGESEGQLISGTVHTGVEPLLAEAVDPLTTELLDLSTEELVHQLDCDAVVPVEDAVDELVGSLLGEVPAP